MIFIDTHAHLYLNAFDGDRDAMVQRAINKGIEKVVLPNIDSSSIPSLKQLCKKYPANCYPLMGLHPTSVKDDFEHEIALITSEIDQYKYYGIGETGIDLYRDKTYYEQQEKAFKFQLELAIQHDLPVVIHARESFDEIFRIMSLINRKNLKGIFHAFTGNIEQAKYIIEEYKFKLGIGGIITFKNSGLDNVIEQIKPEHLVIETDAPFLAPVPNRGKRNESSYLMHIAEKIALIKHMSIEELADITTYNAAGLFKL